MAESEVGGIGNEITQPPSPSPSPSPAPRPAPSPITATIPENSVSIDFEFNIKLENLNLLSNSSISSLLAVSNIGSATSSRINTALDFISNISEQESFLLNGSLLNGLENNQDSSNYSFNAVSSTYFKIILFLNVFQPSNLNPKIFIENANNSYYLNVSNNNSIKKLEFNNIPKEFLTSFYVKNQTGAAFSNYGNSIIVIGI